MLDYIFVNGKPIRGIFMITDWCILGDCSQPECHHCFPVKNCQIHDLCKKEGKCDFIPVPNIKDYCKLDSTIKKI